MVRDVTKGAVVAGASVLFLILAVGLVWAGDNENAAVVLDLDEADGNQELTTKTVDAGQEVTVQVYATVINLKTFKIRIAFDPEKLSFEEGFVESRFTGVADLSGNEVAAGGFYSKGKSGDPLLLATLIFKPLEGFGEAALTVSMAEFTSVDDVKDTPAQTATVRITGVSVEAESWGKVKARFVQ